MSDSLHVTIVYETGDDDWIVASIPEVPGVHSQGEIAFGLARKICKDLGIPPPTGSR